MNNFPYFEIGAVLHLKGSKLNECWGCLLEEMWYATYMDTFFKTIFANKSNPTINEKKKKNS